MECVINGVLKTFILLRLKKYYQIKKQMLKFLSDNSKQTLIKRLINFTIEKGSSFFIDKEIINKSFTKAIILNSHLRHEFKYSITNNFKAHKKQRNLFVNLLRKCKLECLIQKSE